MSVRLAALFAALLAVPALVSPAVAQTRANVDLFAEGAVGLAEGATVVMGGNGKGSVRKVTEGTFEIKFEKGVTATVTFDEPVKCLFTQETVIQGQPSSLLRFDFTRVAKLQLGQQDPLQGLNSIVLQLAGPEDLVQVFSADGTLSNVPPVASIVTSLNIDQVEAAIRALRQNCPAP
ncbi:MAG: hypothetical protein ABL879_14720 [Devosia sp.]